MVKAILDGRKSCTRRIVKLPQYIQKEENGTYTLFAEGTIYENQCFDQVIPYFKKPYQVGDILYVRETWLLADGCAGEGYYYRADETGTSKELRIAYGYKWHPSIHMPKEAARIWLMVNDVRVERLQDITEEDAIKEGFPDLGMDVDSSLERFSTLWDRTIKREDIGVTDWESNPWVLVYEFQRCEKPMDK